MSSIGSRPGLGSGSQLEVSAARPVGPVAGPVFVAQSGASTAAPSPTPAGASQTGTAPAPAMVSTTALSAGSAPVDADRVSAIRKAIANGSYPLIPTKISDAMIAAGLTLRIRK